MKSPFAPPIKVMLIQFKLLGDAVFLIPAINALKANIPNAEIHVLVSREATPIFSDLHDITKLWGFPRKRNKLNLVESWPLIKELRKERFDISIDVVGNDRGSLLTRLINAKTKWGAVRKKTSLFQRTAYSQKITLESISESWIQMYLQMMAVVFKIQLPEKPKMFISTNSIKEALAKEIIQGSAILFHLGSSQQKKEWPVSHWVELYHLAKNAGYNVIFSAGPNEHETKLLQEAKTLAPDIKILPKTEDLALFLALLKQAKLLVASDTGPLHFAAGVGTKVIGLFGTADSIRRAGPIYSNNELVIGMPCTCLNKLERLSECQNKENSCMQSIKVISVFNLLKLRYPIN
jgi:hypothetical protein